MRSIHHSLAFSSYFYDGANYIIKPSVVMSVGSVKKVFPVLGEERRISRIIMG